MTLYRWIVLAAVVAIVVFVNLSGLDSVLSLDTVIQQKDRLKGIFEESPVRLGLAFFFSYVMITALSIPGAALLTLAAGAIFGFGWGVVIASFASTLGATLAMLMVRWLFRDIFENRFSDQLETINSGIEKDGSYYLFSLRMVPIFPFFIINALMGLTKLSAISFFLVSQIGMLAGTLVYVNAGTQLGSVETVSQIFSTKLLLSFALLGLFPLFAKFFVEKLNSKHLYEAFSEPEIFERDIVVIGAGSGGLVAALIGTTLKAKVTLIEKELMGGDCLNTGCVPSKALIRSARHVYENGRAASLGFKDTVTRVNFGKLMDRVVRIIETIEPKDSVERYQSLGVEVLVGEARIISPWHVRVNGRTISTRRIILATGATPVIPDIEG
ncbi:MAG: pyridine nucleotide-disulfide oxidoreductase, partial [Gammaproteobacteria bacterium]|nr:pyridine nucleotide-disulfide oxidoreductase [Gammaproteobacteria bacterium]